MIKQALVAREELRPGEMRAGKAIWRDGAIVRIMSFALGFGTFFAEAQVTSPKSLEGSPGIHVYEYDGKTHRSADHYESLCRIVLNEFALPSDSIPSIDLVFVDQATKERLNVNNPERFHSSDWYGAFIKPSLILMIGEEEADDTFMHEFMHLLQQDGLLFKNIPASAVHQLIEKNEGLLLGSKSYLEFLKATPK